MIMRETRYNSRKASAQIAIALNLRKQVIDDMFGNSYDSCCN
jgi:hypothetical protein